ncbi:unnamed protein product, partial [Oncorhynchus mykiss]
MHPERATMPVTSHLFRGFPWAKLWGSSLFPCQRQLPCCPTSHRPTSLQPHPIWPTAMP